MAAISIADITVNVPEGSSIEVSGVSADIDVDDVNGDQSLQTVSGDVEVHGVLPATSRLRRLAEMSK